MRHIKRGDAATWQAHFDINLSLALAREQMDRFWALMDAPTTEVQLYEVSVVKDPPHPSWTVKVKDG